MTLIKSPKGHASIACLVDLNQLGREWGFGIRDWGLGIGDWGLGMTSLRLLWSSLGFVIRDWGLGMTNLRLLKSTSGSLVCGGCIALANSCQASSSRRKPGPRS